MAQEGDAAVSEGRRMNNGEYHEAIPTEYSGVKFRSKSEAIFARNLELRGWPKWQYEPKSLDWELDGWLPDFWVVGGNQRIHRNFSFLIEYKPCLVTDAYKDWLFERFRFIESKRLGHGCVLACGNSFNKDRRTFYINGDFEWVECEEKIRVFECIEEAAKYRFDLQKAVTPQPSGRFA